MKKIITIYSILIACYTHAGGFIFPNVEYSYARLYLFNTESPSDDFVMFDFDIYKNGKYANSKIGNGWEVSNELVQKMNGIFRHGVDQMVTGLSGCYIPRHGIIYFDDLGTPVASFSACFECERISFWSSKPLPKFKEITSEKNTKKTEQQFADLVALLEHYKIPIFNIEPEYAQLADDDSLYSCVGEMFFDYTTTRAFGDTKLTSTEIKKWIINPDFRLTEKMETTFSAREEDTTSWSYSILAHGTETKFIFASKDNDAVLSEASILVSDIKLPNGLSVGMSLDQVQNSFQVWDGLAYPASIVVNYSDATIRYIIDKRTLRRIEIVIL